MRDRWYALVALGVVILLVGGILATFQVDISVVVMVLLIIILGGILVLGVDFWRKRQFFNKLLQKIDELDQAYLVLETMREPDFYEGQLVFEAMREIDKSMTENVRSEREKVRDFKEYIEMWIHEVKRPLASLVLVVENLWKSREIIEVSVDEGGSMNGVETTGKEGEKAKLNKGTEPSRKGAKNKKNEQKIEENAVLKDKISGNLRNLERYVDQVLYFVRSEDAEKDYLIRKTNLTEVVKKVGMRNMEDFLDNGVEFEVGEVDFAVATDGKWLEFILNQIVNNSIKYRRKTGAKVRIRAWEEGNEAVLEIWDNGIGIAAGDLPQVFEKSFTGENGRKRETSTGMGLYIAKNLCEKLGHRIEIDSEEGEWTKVRIKFGENEFFEVTKR